MGAAAALDVVMAALVAMILAAALLPLFRPLLVGALGSVPVIGGYLQVNADALLARAYAFSIRWSEAAVSPLADLIARIWTQTFGWVDGQLQVDRATVGALWRVRYQALPALQLAVEQYARELARGIQLYAQQLVLGAERYALALEQAEQARAAQAEAQLGLYAQQLAQAAEGYARALAGEELAFTQQAVLGAEAFAARAALGAEGYALELATQVLDLTRKGLLEGELYARRVGLDAEDYARALQDLAVRHTDAVGAAVLAAGVAATAVVAERVTELEDSPCQRQCGILGELGLGLGALDLALLFQLAEASLTDPRGGVQLVEGVVGGPARDLGLKLLSWARGL